MSFPELLEYLTNDYLHVCCTIIYKHIRCFNYKQLDFNKMPELLINKTMYIK